MNNRKISKPKKKSKEKESDKPNRKEVFIFK